jgi:hypothetical protein
VEQLAERFVVTECRLQTCVLYRMNHDYPDSAVFLYNCQRVVV